MRDERLLVVLLLPILLCPTAVSAANTQGLEWGLSVGDRIDYTVTSMIQDITTTSTTQSVSECYIEVLSLPELPDIVASIPTLQGEHVNQTFVNGTRYFFPWIAVPIGNWTLLTEFLQSSIPTIVNVTIVDTMTEWGLESTQEYGSNTMTQSLRMSKSDGAMNYLKQETLTTNPSTHYLVEVSRKGVVGSLTPLQLISLTITLASLGVIAVVGVLIIRKRPSEPFTM